MSTTAMVTFKCPVCKQRLRVLQSVEYATCDNNGKHRQVRMERGKS